MKLNTICLFLFTFGILISNCGDNNEDRFAQEWLIPSDRVFDGGVGQDGIPAVDDPNFSSVSEIDFLSDNALVVGIFSDTEVKAYPHPILDWHEIVNDEIGDKSVAVTYCPLTGTAIGWDRNVNGSKTTFGVSGKLYQTNLIPFDRATESYWSQIRLDCVNGNLINTKINTSPVVETTWATWKQMYPNSLVMNTNTGFSRNYQQFPYGDYRTNNANLLFPVDPLDQRLGSKNRVLGVLGDQEKRVYSIDLFESPRVIHDVLDGQNLVIVGSKEMNFIVAYEDNSLIEGLEINLDNLPIVGVATNGNQVTLFGQVLDSNGNFIQNLNNTESFIAYWFSLGAFYPGIEIYE